jgi:hypothetical protein
MEERGQDFFGMLYGKVAERVLHQMDNSGTEDLGLVARLMYSHILSNVSVLNAADTSFVMIAALIPQDVRSHSYVFAFLTELPILTLGR